MRLIETNEFDNIAGGFKLNIGQWVGALCVGAMTGPVGFGMALGGLLIAHGTNNVYEMGKDEGIW